MFRILFVFIVLAFISISNASASVLSWAYTEVENHSNNSVIYRAVGESIADESVGIIYECEVGPDYKFLAFYVGTGEVYEQSVYGNVVYRFRGDDFPTHTQWFKVFNGHALGVSNHLNEDDVFAFFDNGLMENFVYVQVGNLTQVTLDLRGGKQQILNVVKRCQ